VDGQPSHPRTETGPMRFAPEGSGHEGASLPSGTDAGSLTKAVLDSVDIADERRASRHRRRGVVVVHRDPRRRRPVPRAPRTRLLEVATPPPDRSRPRRETGPAAQLAGHPRYRADPPPPARRLLDPAREVRRYHRVGARHVLDQVRPAASRADDSVDEQQHGPEQAIVYAIEPPARRIRPSCGVHAEPVGLGRALSSV
jgi:hypothetical protein